MSGHDETIHPDYIPEDFRELLRMACDSVWEQGELYSEDLLLAAFKPAIDEHDRQIAEQAWENGYIQALKNMNPTSSEERLALKACAQCPAICECARYAAEHALINGYPLQGIWGGINRSKGKNYRNNEKEM